ncbi:hypothetical protein A1O1_06316 [Capronia coronata CBS 617.96]|uniref:Nuclease S1 n=1 Tax=Capronia coronata CBS 617.96 TaxID=1182541 RepID=W9XZI4_9EURO|nr:uncharacterized protein A1O1_06316 [Capronia coronata CBS 617.96]EXJ85947.1 hypothetical protein A1O1_06316 [Capronia coronata CBS 617.96]
MHYSSTTIRFRPVLLLAFTLSFSFTKLAYAWGSLGHETVAWIAQSYVSPATESTIKALLESNRTDYMANVSTWADSYRYTSEGRWTAPLHYIDANDDPPSSCSVDYARDCGDAGCSVSAIVNYTSILLNGHHRPSSSRNASSAAVLKDAARFIIHFIGDLHQPLHDEALDVGGNTINVTYDGEDTNLHHIWDTEIVEQLADGMDAHEFAENLTKSIEAGDYGWNVNGWLSGVVSVNNTLATAMEWASEANAFVCTDVLQEGVDAVEDDGDLSRSYYEAHYDVARVQIAKAGYRLGIWLNLIVTGRMDG